LIRPFSLVTLNMSHIIRDNKIYKGSSSGGVALGNIRDNKIYKGSSSGGVALGNIRDNKIYKGSSSGGVPLNINSTIHSAIKDSKGYDLALMVAAYHFLIKPIF
jgi:hypothetical protein